MAVIKNAAPGSSWSLDMGITTNQKKWISSASFPGVGTADQDGRVEYDGYAIWGRSNVTFIGNGPDNTSCFIQAVVRVR